MKCRPNSLKVLLKFTFSEHNIESLRSTPKRQFKLFLHVKEARERNFEWLTYQGLFWKHLIFTVNALELLRGFDEIKCKENQSKRSSDRLRIMGLYLHVQLMRKPADFIVIHVMNYTYTLFSFNLPSNRRCK
jgi:hypothetical protein